MTSSGIKNNIYALISLIVILLTIASFVLITEFMVNMNNLVFSMSDGPAATDNISLNVVAYDNAKDLLEIK